MSPSTSPHSSFSSMTTRRPVTGGSISGSIFGSSSTLSKMRPLMGLSSSSLEFNFASLTLDGSDNGFGSRSSSSLNSSESVFFFKPSQPFEKYDLSKDFQGSTSSINLDELEQSPAAPLIENFLEPWLSQLKNVNTLSGAPLERKQNISTKSSSPNALQTKSETESPELTSVDDVAASLKAYASSRTTQVQQILESLNASRLLVPYLDLALPIDTILEYNQLDADDPQILSLQLDPIIAPEIRELSVFLDRYDTEKGVVCLLIWSNIDQALVCLPSLGLQPYPLCWKCNSKFGTVPCPKCGIAKYCSSTCLHDQEKLHCKACPDMANYVQRHNLLVIDPASNISSCSISR